MHILVLDTDDTSRESLSRILRGAGHSVMIAGDLAEALNHWSPEACDLVLMDESCQAEAFSRIKEHNQDIPIVTMSQSPSIESIIVSLRRGTFDYLIKPFTDTEELMEVLERVRRAIEANSNQRSFLKRVLKTFSELSFANETIRERGYAEGITDQYYSQFFEDILSIELARSQRFNHNFTVVSIRLDYLLQYTSPESNAEFSSQSEAIASFLHQRMRRTDVLVRTAATEFMIILVENTKEAGRIVVEELRQGITAIIPAEVRTVSQAEGIPPVSIGMATYPFDGMETQDLITAACQCQ